MVAARYDARDFAPVDCVCGRSASVGVKWISSTSLYEVQVSCDHGGYTKTGVNAYNEYARYDDKTIVANINAGARIAPLGGAKLGASLGWKPIPPRVGADGLPIQQTVVSFNPFSPPTPSTPPQVGFRPVKGVVAPTTNTRKLPRHLPAEQLDVGDVIEEQTKCCVLLGKVSKPGQKWKLTFRSIEAEPTYKSIEVAIDAMFRVVADVAQTSGDPDKFVMVELVERTRRQRAYEADPNAAPDYLREKIAEDVDRSGGYKNQDVVMHGGYLAMVRSVRHLAMGSESMVMLGLTYLEGPQRGKDVSVEPRHVTKPKVTSTVAVQTPYGSTVKAHVAPGVKIAKHVPVAVNAGGFAVPAGSGNQAMIGMSVASSQPIYPMPGERVRVKRPVYGASYEPWLPGVVLELVHDPSAGPTVTVKLDDAGGTLMRLAADSDAIQRAP